MLQGNVITADPVDAQHDWLQRARVVPVPMPDLILLVVRVFLAVGVLAVVDMFVRRTVDAIRRRHGGGQYEAYDMRRATSVDQIIVQDVGRKIGRASCREGGGRAEEAA